MNYADAKFVQMALATLFDYYQAFSTNLYLAWIIFAVTVNLTLIINSLNLL
jgi:hypothetical protein